MEKYSRRLELGLNLQSNRQCVLVANTMDTTRIVANSAEESSNQFTQRKVENISAQPDTEACRKDKGNERLKLTSESAGNHNQDLVIDVIYTSCKQKKNEVCHPFPHAILTVPFHWNHEPNGHAAKDSAQKGVYVSKERDRVMEI